MNTSYEEIQQRADEIKERLDTIGGKLAATKQALMQLHPQPIARPNRWVERFIVNNSPFSAAYPHTPKQWLDLLRRFVVLYAISFALSMAVIGAIDAALKVMK